MARVKRKEIKFTEDSLNELYQEIYNDTHNFKAMITAVLTKWSPYIKDEGNVAAMGKEIVNLMNAIARTNDQKIVLVKILKDIVFAKKGVEDSEAGKQTANDSNQVSLSDDAKNQLMKMADELRKQYEKSGDN